MVMTAGWRQRRWRRRDTERGGRCGERRKHWREEGESLSSLSLPCHTSNHIWLLLSLPLCSHSPRHSRHSKIILYRDCKLPPPLLPSSSPPFLLSQPVAITARHYCFFQFSPKLGKLILSTSSFEVMSVSSYILQIWQSHKPVWQGSLFLGPSLYLLLPLHI